MASPLSAAAIGQPADFESKPESVAPPRLRRRGTVARARFAPQTDHGIMAKGFMQKCSGNSEDKDSMKMAQAGESSA